MIARFDGTDESAQIQEKADLKVKYGMSNRAMPMAFNIDGEWQVWWADPPTGFWFHRDPAAGVVQVPLDEVP